MNRKLDASGFDAISAGGVLAWLMDCLDTGALTTEELGVTWTPRWDVQRFDVVKDSMHNADLGCELIDSILKTRNASIYWVEQFRKDRHEASLQYWFEVRKGIDQSLRDFL